MNYIILTYQTKCNNLQNNAAQNTFRIHYQINGLIPEQAGTHGIYLKDVDGNVQFHISAPYMYDNSGAYSNALSMTIIEYDENEMVVELVADHEWLQDSERTYPVTIDPLFQTDQDRTTVDSAFYSSKNPSYCYGYGGSYWEGSLYVGNTGSGNYAKTRSVLKLNELPDLNTGDKIVAAYLSLYQMECSTEIRVDVHKATSSWNESQVNWNNQPSYDSNIAEYLIQKRSDGVETTRTFDITTMVQEWYNGEENNGVVLRSTAENSSSSCFSWYLSSKYTTYPSARPIFSLVYRNNKGLESYWSYSSASAGEAETAYINNYSGNLVFEQTVLSTTGVNKPVTVSHYYNGYLVGKAYGTDTPGMPPFTGLGWKLNYSQTVFPSSEFGLTGTDASNYPYVYTDADGTDHYFYKKTENGSTTYLDEDGLGLELKINSSSTTARYVISDDEDHTLTFKSNGYLAKISEPAGAENTITSSSGAVTKITDGNGKYITLSAATSGSKQLQSLSTNYGQTVSYTYSNKKLTKITGYDGHDSTYTYDENGLLTSAEDAKGNKLSFTYTNVFSGNRVASVISTTENGTQISKTTFAYPNQYTTVVQNSNVDGEYGTNDDIISTYNFDTFGRTTSIHYESNGKDLGTECYQYTTGTVNSTASNIKKLNRITREHTTGVEVINPLDNHNMEYSTASWTGDGTYDSTQHYYGNRSMKLSSNGTDVKEEQTITLEAGKTYTLSGYVKMTEWSGNGDGASLKLLVGEEVYASERLQTVTDSSIDGGWRRLSVTFTMPQGSSAATVQLFMNAESGVAYFDAIQLEEGKAPSAYNQLENAGLERAASDNSLRPEYWDSATLDYSSEDDHLVTNAYAGNKAFQLAGGPSINKQIFQDVPVVGTEEDTYVVSAWAKANAVPNDDNSHRKFLIAARITYSDGKTLYKFVGYYNPAITDWQYVTASFTLSDNNSSTNKTVTAVAVCAEYYYEAQNMLIDNLQLIKEAVPTYTYDDDGNLIRVTDNAEQKSSMEYSNGNLTKSIDAKGYDYEYTYNTNHTLKKATSQTGVSYNYTYESKGRPTKLVVEDNDSNSSTKIETNVTYSSGKSYVASETDANGNTIDYTYVSGYGDLQTATTEIGNQTVENSYTYDSSTRLPLTTTQTVTSADGSTASKTVTNTYDQYHQLTALESPTTEYSFAYNDLGLMTSTSVGERTLAINTYTPAGLLTKSTYGNEFELGYVYDDYGNIIKKTFDGETAVEYFADRSGTIVRAQDYLSGYRYENSFDGLGRTIRSAIFPLGNSIFDPLLTFEYGYDLNNNVTKYAVETPMGAYTSTYTYGKDNLLESAELDGKSYTYSYDAFNRLTSVAADDVVTQSYYYKQSDRGTGYSTYQISSETIGEDTYSYSYDEAGNITQIRGTDTAVLQWYEYDGFGQLIKEEDVEKHQTILYTYDDGGNILKKTDNGGNVLSSYAYEDTSWGDLLTKYNGQTITYDEIGNPLQYRDGITLTWKNGRRLATYQKGDTSISYDYDADGMRTKKTVGDTVSSYVYAGSQLTYETRGEEAFTYLYDANGIIRKLLYQSADGTISTYYYATNSRGDVIALYNSQGDKVVTYEYDAWGNVWSVGGSEAAGIGAKNPIRYRGYYYDVETEWYYLQSRYYDPEVGRWINVDNQLSIGSDLIGLNLFAYCGNNPVNHVDSDGRAWKDIKNWFTNTWNKVKKTANKIVETIKEKVYSAYYNVTKCHFEDRQKKNGKHPTYSEVNKRNSGWKLLSKSQSIYHDNGVGQPELKYITSDGREAVFDGDTLEPVTDPRYIATYNYCPLYQIPSTGAGILDYAKLAGSAVGHFFADMVPYYLTGNSNTREQFESKVFLFD